MSSAIQGLGLVIALLMATTGTIGYFLWTEGTAMTGLAQAVFEVRGALANVMWGYVIVHVGAALLHELLGHRVLRPMSPLPHARAELEAPHPRQVADAGGLRE